MPDLYYFIVAVITYTVGFASGRVDRKIKQPKFEWLCLRENCNYRTQAANRSELDVKVDEHREFHREHPGARYE